MPVPQRALRVRPGGGAQPCRLTASPPERKRREKHEESTFTVPARTPKFLGRSPVEAMPGEDVEQDQGVARRDFEEAKDAAELELREVRLDLDEVTSRVERLQAAAGHAEERLASLERNQAFLQDLAPLIVAALLQAQPPAKQRRILDQMVPALRRQVEDAVERSW